MTWRIEIKEKDGVFDTLGEGIQKDILDLGLKDIRNVRVTQVFTLAGELNDTQARKIADGLLADRVTQEYNCYQQDGRIPFKEDSEHHVVEIAYNLGVMDPVEESTVKGIRDIGIQTIRSVRTSRQYHLYGPLTSRDMDLIVDKVLANKLIQHVVTFPIHVSKSAPAPQDYPSVKVAEVDLRKATDRALLQLSREKQLFLNFAEMRTIKKHFVRLGRAPTDVELETIAQTWSEHCRHKTFRGDINYRARENGKTTTKKIRNLLKSTIAKATYSLNKPWCVSVFHDNAGVIKFDETDHVCFKVETHNHPSALEPFGGANTGIGGVIRDILGTGLGGRPVCNTDIFCFAPPEYDFKKLPAGTLHPKRVMKGVVSGVRDYGNKMGIPTVNGAILFDEKFVGNPLVFCGTVGLIPKGKEKKKVSRDDLIVVVGGRTGRDGIHGATFSSGELTEDSEVVSSGAVQIGHPIQEKKVLDVLLQARDRGLYASITDCGAGGLSSAVGEMGSELGARVDLDKVPLKYQGLSYTEIWISESQERMVLSVNPAKIKELLALFESENVEATVIGEFTGTKRLELFFRGAQVCNLAMSFLHDGIPRITKEATWSKPSFSVTRDPKSAGLKDLTDSLLNVLSHYNVCSKEWVIRQYDHEVQGGSVIKPLVGVHCDGPSDAAVIAPKLGSRKGLAIANGINVRYGMIDPYWMAAACVDEAIRQIIAIGGDPERIALLDNFCWGNPDKPDRLGGLVRTALGCYQAAVAYGTPFISGKDSLYNEFIDGKKSIAIPGTILISAIGIVNDITKCVTMDFKRAGNLIYVVGLTKSEMGGSIYYDTLGYLGSQVPKTDFTIGRKIFAALSQAIKSGLVAAAHDCSEGGLGAALAEMAFSGGLGVSARLDLVPSRSRLSDEEYLFSETCSRFIVEIDPKNKSRFERQLKGLPCAVIGRVEESPEFIVYGTDQRACVQAYINDLKAAWKKPLNW